jgi:hypothetical protein
MGGAAPGPAAGGTPWPLRRQDGPAAPPVSWSSDRSRKPSKVSQSESGEPGRSSAGRLRPGGGPEVAAELGDTAGPKDTVGLGDAAGLGDAPGVEEATVPSGAGAASGVVRPLRRMPSRRPEPGRQRAVIGRCTAGGMNGRATINGAGWFLPGAAVDGLGLAGSGAGAGVGSAESRRLRSWAASLSGSPNRRSRRSTSCVSVARVSPIWRATAARDRAMNRSRSSGRSVRCAASPRRLR